MMVFDDIIGGFATLFSDQFAIWFVILAAFVGIIFGALPGLTAAAAIAMMLPILIAYNDEIGGLAGLAFLYVIGKSGRYGGSIAAILFNTPGTAASAAKFCTSLSDNWALAWLRASSAGARPCLEPPITTPVDTEPDLPVGPN